MTKKIEVEAETAVIETPAPAPVIEFESVVNRALTVPLQWPLVIDGTPLRDVTVRRLTGSEVGELQELMAQESFSDEVMMAFFCDQTQTAMGSLDQDDFQLVKAKVLDFLPKQVRAALEAAQEQYLAGVK